MLAQLSKLFTSTFALSVFALCFANAWASNTSSVSTSVPSVLLRTHAAAETAQHNAACQTVKPFYWEIGNKSESLASGSVGGTHYTASTLMPIASSSKWIWGAYVVQARNGHLSASDVASLTMTSGYTNFGATSCIKLLPAKRDAQTVNECFNNANPKGGNNSDFNAAAVGKFFYNGGHFQKQAVDMGLGADSNEALQHDIQTQLGSDFVFTYGSPQLAGGINTSPNNYAIFLRKILNRQLYLSDLLGTYAVCTNPATCPTALYTPVPSTNSWDYSLGHWVETDGDGAFSSAGAFGFYPWIDATKTYYGILARQGRPGSGADSAICGGLIRKAWMTGKEQ